MAKKNYKILKESPTGGKSGLIVGNLNIGELSDQKTKAGEVNQVPFSLGFGTSNRSRGQPYYSTVGAVPSYDNINAVSKDVVRDPIIYFDFQTSGSSCIVTNRGLSGSAASGNMHTFGESGCDTLRHTTDSSIVMSGTYSMEFNYDNTLSQDQNDGYIYVSTAEAGGFSPEFGTADRKWTVSMWWKSTRSTIFNLWWVGHSSETENTSVGLYVNADHSFVMDGNGYSQASNRLSGTAVADIRDGNYHNCIVTYDQSQSGGSRANIYVDGNNITFKDTLNVAEYDVNNDSFLIGRGLHRSSNRLSGAVGEFAYWDRVLTTNELEKIYTKGNPGIRSTDLLTTLDVPVYD